MAKVQLEMGGKNPLIVLDDADLPLPSTALSMEHTFPAGSAARHPAGLLSPRASTTSSSSMRERLSTLVVDHALKAGADIGPVVDERQLQKNLDYIQIGVEEERRCLWG